MVPMAFVAMTRNHACGSLKAGSNKGCLFSSLGGYVCNRLTGK